MSNGKKAPVMVRVHDGTRALMPAGMQLLFRVIDGNRKSQHDEFHNNPVLRADVPFFDNFGDKYTVIVSADNYVQSGFYPIPVKPGVLSTVDIMLLPQNNRFNFRDALWGNLKQTHPGLTRILGQGVGESEAEDRYTQLMEEEPASLAAVLNITTALEQILFPTGTALDLFKTLIWDDPSATMASDRFYAFADSGLVEQLKTAELAGIVEEAPSALHPGATSSYKEVEFGEANVQLTLHGNDKKSIDGVDCIKVEADMDYYKDTGSHLIIEVLVNQFGGKTDPRVIYVLRWTAGRRAGRPEFNPPFTIQAA